LNNYEIVGIAVIILSVAVALWLGRLQSMGKTVALVDTSTQLGTVAVAGSQAPDATASSLEAASTATQTTSDGLMIDDVVLGAGEAVKTGDTVTVHYVGTFQNGQQFDSSYDREQPFSFTVGKGQVIKGWDEGLVGMQVGGKRVLVVPSDLAYGAAGGGPIPPNTTLVFTIELLSIK